MDDIMSTIQAGLMRLPKEMIWHYIVPMSAPLTGHCLRAQRLRNKAQSFIHDQIGWLNTARRHRLMDALRQHDFTTDPMFLYEDERFMLWLKLAMKNTKFFFVRW